MVCIRIVVVDVWEVFGFWKCFEVKLIGFIYEIIYEVYKKRKLRMLLRFLLKKEKE